MKKYKTFWTIVVILIVVLFLVQQSSACTIFYVQGESTHYFASNEDWSLTNPIMQVVPGQNEKYGYIVFGWDSHLPQYPQGGVNEHGLCLDWAALPPEIFKANPSRKQLNRDIFYEILENCKNVTQASSLVKQYNWSQFAQEHLLVADSQGNSCVIEWRDGEYLVLTKEKSYQVVTNFWLSNSGQGWYPCNRFDTVDGYLKNPSNSKPDLATIRNLLNQSHQEGQYQTIYSYIVDVKSLDIYIYYRHNYLKEIKCNLKQEIAKGARRIKLYQ